MATKQRKAKTLRRKSTGRRKEVEDGASIIHGKSRTPGEQSESPGFSREASSYKTPKRMIASKSRLPSFSSPGNEADMPQEIFWDPNSPVAYKLGNYPKKQTVSSHMVEISDIVNRIAPQDEKSACNENPLLGLWIGDDAIPCTPGITKVRSRTKINGPRRLQLKNREEELIKLAKQFDQNFTDAIQDQDASSHPTPEINVSIQRQNEVQMEDQLSVGDHSKTDGTLPIQGFNQRATTVEHSENNQRFIDLEAEHALNALFDCPTQKCSHRLSQSLSDCPSNNSFHGSQGALMEAKDTSDKIFPAGRSVYKDVHLVEPSVSVSAKEPKPTSEPTTLPNATFATKAVGSCELDEVVVNDFDEWGTDLLLDDSFVMQITQNPELIATPKMVLSCVSSENGRKNDKVVNSRKPASAPCAFNAQSSAASQKGTIKSGATTLVSLGDDSHLNDDKTNSISKSSQNKISSCHFVPVSSDNKNVQEGFTQLKYVASTTFPEKRDASVLLQSNLPNPWSEKHKSSMQSVCHQSPVVSPVAKPQALRDVTHQAGTSKGLLEHNEVLKKSTFPSNKWNGLRFSGKAFGSFCESASPWGTSGEDDDDDDLLYQICDDVEKSTQSQVCGKENKKAELVVGNISTLKLNPCLSGPPRGPCSLPQASKSHVGRKTFSLEVPDTGTVLLKKDKTSVQRNCEKFKVGSISSVSGKFCRSNSVPAEGFLSVMGTDAFSNAALNMNSIQGLNDFCNVSKLHNNGSMNQVTTEKSKYIFRKNNSSQDIVPDHKHINDTSCVRINPEFGESKDPSNVPLWTPVNSNPLFKRQHSEGSSQIEAVQKGRRCSEEEIARKKQEALQRRKYKMQVLLKSTAPT